MRLQRKIVIGSVIAAWVAGWVAPPDMVSKITLAVAATLLCGIPLSMLARRDDFRASSKYVQSLVCVLICLVSVLVVWVYVAQTRITGLSQELQSWQGQETGVMAQSTDTDTPAS